jgi:hypothetical protein
MLLVIPTIGAFLIPETYIPQIHRDIKKKEGKVVTARGATFQLFLVSVGRPLHMILFEPVSPLLDPKVSPKYTNLEIKAHLPKWIGCFCNTIRHFCLLRYLCHLV